MKDIYHNHNAAAVLISLLEGEKKMSQLQKAIKNYSTLKLTVMDLEKEGYVKTREVTEGRKIIYVSLTQKGKAVAEKLKEVEEVAKMTPEELEERRKNLHWIVDINTYADHVTGYDIHNGKKEIFNVWLKMNGKYLTLYCDKCHSESCYHVLWALQDPYVGDKIREIAKEKGLKIKNEIEL